MRIADVLAAAALVTITIGAPSASEAERAVRVGSKKFTESVILGEIATQLAASTGVDARHRAELGGTRLLWSALVSGEVDVYPEYTGTLRYEIFAGHDLPTDEDLADELARAGIGMTPALGFNNTYAIGMQAPKALALRVKTITDLAEFDELEIAFTNEFMDREDGWPGLRRHYRLPHMRVVGLDHDLAYRGLLSGRIDATDLYSTDAEIQHYDLAILEDDKDYFPEYRAVLLYRLDFAREAPEVLTALERLAGTLPDDTMIDLNVRSKIYHQPEPQIAASFLRQALGIIPTTEPTAQTSRLWSDTAAHLQLVGLSLFAAIIVALPLGMLAAKRRRVGRVILAVVGIVQTIPALALLVFMVPVLGIGAAPALAALFLYSLLPIVRNTYTGLTDISPSILEAADAMGLAAIDRLRLIEMPMASRSILAGIKTSAVINIGTATLGALIGAGGYGQPILTGIRLNDTMLILQGAVPAAVLALVVQLLFDLSDRIFVPRGLRLEG
jgi:osmoprotectant transport system permease protein